MSIKQYKQIKLGEFEIKIKYSCYSWILILIYYKVDFLLYKVKTKVNRHQFFRRDMWVTPPPIVLPVNFAKKSSGDVVKHL